jgi:hypothetical protein
MTSGPFSLRSRPRALSWSSCLVCIPSDPNRFENGIGSQGPRRQRAAVSERPRFTCQGGQGWPGLHQRLGRDRRRAVTGTGTIGNCWHWLSVITGRGRGVGAGHGRGRAWGAAAGLPGRRLGHPRLPRPLPAAGRRGLGWAATMAPGMIVISEYWLSVVTGYQ